MDDDELRRRYAAGATMRELADELGCAVSTVHLRIPASQRRRRGRPAAPVADAEIVRLHDEEGMGFGKVADHLGIDKSTASRRYRAATTA